MSEAMGNRLRYYDSQLAQRVRCLRVARGLSLDQLAYASGVSRSTISLVERGESSPTVRILGRLAAAFGVAIAFLLDGSETRPLGFAVSLRNNQVVWCDPDTGYRCTKLSPHNVDASSALSEASLPSGTTVSYIGQDADKICRQIFIIEGNLIVISASATYLLAVGDCLSLNISGPINCINNGSELAGYLIVSNFDDNHKSI